VNFNFHRDLENYYCKQLLLFCPFRCTEEFLKNGHNTWHDAFNQQQERIMSIRNEFVYKLNLKANTMMNGVHCTLHIPLPEATEELNKLPKCPISTNIEGIEPYDLSIIKIEQKHGIFFFENLPNCPDKIISNSEFKQ
jgi:hypothetical protein